MPCQTPLWTEYLICPICTNEFAANLRVPITLRCGHSICRKCLATIQQCPYDQSTITKDLDHLPINYALLQLTSSAENNNVEPEILPSIVQSLSTDELQCYKLAKGCIEGLALYMKPNGNSVAGIFSRPMQRKLVTLINCQLIEEEGRARSLRAARSLGERTVTELILQHQNPQQLSANLWAAVRARGCQFLGPAMQEEVLKLVLLALEDGVSLCRKVLVMFVVQRLETTFPQASKTSIGHVVQLLYRASCFIVSKRDGDSSLMQLKEEFRTYKSLRKEHDAQIVQIATEAGLRIAPDQWSALLYGDPDHKSDMQSLIDKQQSPQSFGQSVQELMIALQRTNDPANLSALRGHLTSLAAIDASPDINIVPTWKECADAVEAVKHVVNGLVEFMQNHGSRKSQESSHSSHTTRYKISFCRDLSIRGNCPRGPNCTFAHNEEELERYRAKIKKNNVRQSIKGPVNFSGPNPKVNICQPPFAGKQEIIPSRFNKSMPYRSENSLHHTPVKTSSHHLMPTYPSNASSSSTPNLSQAQLSPKLTAVPQASQMNRFSYNEGYGKYTPNFLDTPAPALNQTAGYHPNYRPQQSVQSISSFIKPMSSGYSPEFSKQFSPYERHTSVSHSPAMMKHSGHFQLHPQMTRYDSDHSNNNQDDNKYSTINWRSGNASVEKLKSLTKSPNHLMMPMAKSPMSSNSSHTSPINRSNRSQMEMDRHIQRNISTDEVDGLGLGKMWISDKQQSVFQFNPAQSKDNFIRSDSILTSNTDDEFSFDSMNMSTENKYGAIGIKNHPMDNNRQWSGLHSAMPKRQDNSSNGIAGEAGCLKNARINSNGTSNRQLKQSFFDSSEISEIPVTSTPKTPPVHPNRSFWNEGLANWSKGQPSYELSSEDSLGLDGMYTKNLWEMMNE